VPKSIAIQYPERVALATAIPMKWSADIILKPLIMLLNGSGVLILKLLGVEYSAEHSHVHSPEEILILVKEAHSGGLLDADERRLLQNVFRVGDVHAGEIAISRTRMVAAEINDPVEKVLELVAESAFTRIPIYEKDIDHVVGFVHLKELFNLYKRDPAASLKQVLRTVPFVPESLPGTEVWERLNEVESYLAIVIDEYGGTAGMLTREDLIEELFGELQDEFDRERALITPAGAGRLIVRGDMTISYLSDLLDLNLPPEAAHTVGGLVVEILGDVPEVGTTARSGDVQLRVEAVANHAVTSVCVILPPDKATLTQGGLAL
jgi:CBS domain containing-hemolysin-like protein